MVSHGSKMSTARFPSQLRRAPSRRRFLQDVGLGAAGLAAPSILAEFGFGCDARAAEATLNFVSYGGSYGDAVKKYLVDPFQAETKINVSLGVNSTLAALKVQVASGQVQWDLAELAGGEFVAGLKENLFEPLDFKVIDTGKVPTFARNDHGIEYAMFLSGIGYDRSRIADADAPQSWSQFWDVARWPGLRALSEHIADTATLELALLADGAAIDKLYPLDVDRAFASLRRLGKKNIVWYKTNQDPVNFLQQHEGPLAQIPSGRVFIANSQGANMGFVYNEMQLNGDYLVVPRGAKNKEAAFRLINYIVTNDKAAAEWMKATSYALANAKAAELLPPDIADTMPTSPKMKGKYFQKDFQWWGDNFKDVTTRFEEFLATL